jgi:hypothetical protein
VTGAASVYRCAECGHHRHLTAWAGALAFGPLHADGTLASHDTVEDDWLHEDSIQCGKHPGAVLEKSVDGQWCRWWNCPACAGTGKVGGSWRYPQGYPCRAEGISIEGEWGPRTLHQGWFPVKMLAALELTTGGNQ